MRISFILSSLWLSGGVRVIAEYANRLSERGHLLTLVIPGGTFDADIAKELSPSVTVRRSKICRPPVGQPVSPIHMLRLTWSLARSVPQSDLVIATHTPTTAASLIASRLLRLGEPVWFYQDYLEMFTGRPFETWLVRNAQRWHRRTLVVSNASKLELQGFSSGEPVVVGEGLSHAEHFYPLPAQERMRNSGQRNILFLGDMRPRKGLSDFLSAAALVYKQMPKIHLWIVSKEDCQIQTGLPFEYIYRPARQELARLYASCDLFVSASWWESFGLPPLEAMACGAPVVMTDSRGVREYALPGENCLIVPPRNPQSLAKAMLEVLTDDALETRLRQNGPPTSAMFTWERAVDRFEQALFNL